MNDVIRTSNPNDDLIDQACTAVGLHKVRPGCPWCEVERLRAALTERREIVEDCERIKQRLAPETLPCALPPSVSLSETDVAIAQTAATARAEMCAICGEEFIGHRYGARGHDWRPKPIPHTQKAKVCGGCGHDITPAIDAVGYQCPCGHYTALSEPV